MNHGERIVRKSDGLGGFAVGVDSSTWDLYWIHDSEGTPGIALGSSISIAASDLTTFNENFEEQNWAQTLLGTYDLCTIEEEAKYLAMQTKQMTLDLMHSTTAMVYWAHDAVKQQCKKLV
eukprot:PhF_6_TR41939/c0_g1_i1/m.63471